MQKNFWCSLNIHKWDACICQKCGTIRETGHKWKDCVCEKCGTVNEAGHKWQRCICVICKKQRNEDHAWLGCVCFVCGAKKPNAKEIDHKYAMNKPKCDDRCTVCGHPFGQKAHSNFFPEILDRWLYCSKCSFQRANAPGYLNKIYDTKSEILFSDGLVQLYMKEFDVPVHRVALYLSAATLLGIPGDRMQILRDALKRYAEHGNVSGWHGIFPESRIRTGDDRQSFTDMPFKISFGNDEKYWNDLKNWNFKRY